MTNEILKETHFIFVLFLFHVLYVCVSKCDFETLTHNMYKIYCKYWML